MQRKPFITFCIPTYNRAKELEECLDSIIGQILQVDAQIGIIVSDNASNDGTQILMKKYVSQYPFVKYIVNKSNLGYDKNLIQAVRLATSKYVWLFGDDDSLEENILGKVIKILKENSFDYINLGYSLYNNGKKVPSNSFWRKYTPDEEIYITNLNKLILLRNHLFTFMSSHILNKELINFGNLNKFIGIGTGWIHIFMVAECLSRSSKGYYIPHCVKARAGNGRAGDKTFIALLTEVTPDLIQNYNLYPIVARNLEKGIESTMFSLRKFIKYKALSTHQYKSLFDLCAKYEICSMQRRISKLVPKWAAFSFLRMKQRHKNGTVEVQ